MRCCTYEVLRDDAVGTHDGEALPALADVVRRHGHFGHDVHDQPLHGFPVPGSGAAFDKGLRTVGNARGVVVGEEQLGRFLQVLVELLVQIVNISLL